MQEERTFYRISDHTDTSFAVTRKLSAAQHHTSGTKKTCHVFKKIEVIWRHYKESWLFAPLHSPVQSNGPNIESFQEPPPLPATDCHIY